jgi:hypothetical protein
MFCLLRLKTLDAPFPRRSVERIRLTSTVLARLNVALAHFVVTRFVSQRRHTTAKDSARVEERLSHSHVFTLYLKIQSFCRLIQRSAPIPATPRSGYENRLIARARVSECTPTIHQLAHRTSCKRVRRAKVRFAPSDERRVDIRFSASSFFVG